MIRVYLIPNWNLKETVSLKSWLLWETFKKNSRPTCLDVHLFSFISTLQLLHKHSFRKNEIPNLSVGHKIYILHSDFKLGFYQFGIIFPSKFYYKI